MKLKQTLIFFLFLLVCARSSFGRTEGSEEERNIPDRTESIGSRSNCTSNLAFKLAQGSLGERLLKWEIMEISEEQTFRVTLAIPNSAVPAAVDRWITLRAPGEYSIDLKEVELSMDSRYRWTVQAVCNPRKPSHNHVAWTFVSKNSLEGGDPVSGILAD